MNHLIVRELQNIVFILTMINNNLTLASSASIEIKNSDLPYPLPNQD